MVHFAANAKWRDIPIVEKYRNIEIKRNIPDNYDLDFIIPHYNNIEGLRRTIDSTYYKSFLHLHVIVVDDCSTNCDITTLEKEYPGVKFIYSKVNGGPGMARQIGINNSSSPYLMFLDAGDRVSSKLAMSNALKTIKKYNDAYIYSFAWYNPESHKHYIKDMWSLHSSIFQREFIELYGLCFDTSPDASYCGEDLGFMQLAYLNLYHNLGQELMLHYYTYKMTLCTYVPESTSITHTNLYHKAIKGIVYNFKHIVKKAKANNINPNYISNYVTRFFIQLYYDYLKCAQNAPELLEYNMNFIRDYYYNIY